MPRFKTQSSIIDLHSAFTLHDDFPSVAEANQIAYDPAQLAAVKAAWVDLGEIIVNLVLWSAEFRRQTKRRAKPDDYLTEHAAEIRAALAGLEAATAALDRPEYHEPGHPMAPVFERARAALQGLRALDLAEASAS